MAVIQGSHSESDERKGMSVSAAHLVVGVEAGLGEGVEALGGHHACNSARGRLHMAQLRQEQRRAQEANLRTAQPYFLFPLGWQLIIRYAGPCVQDCS